MNDLFIEFAFSFTNFYQRSRKGTEEALPSSPYLVIRISITLFSFYSGIMFGYVVTLFSFF